jgi:hypothetical protein
LVDDVDTLNVSRTKFVCSNGSVGCRVQYGTTTNSKAHGVLIDGSATHDNSAVIVPPLR